MSIRGSGGSLDVRVGLWKLEPTANDGMVVGRGRRSLRRSGKRGSPLPVISTTSPAAGVGNAGFDGDLSVGLDANFAGAYEAC